MTADYAKTLAAEALATGAPMVAKCVGCGEFSWVERGRCFCCGGRPGVPPRDVRFALQGYGFGFYGGSQ